MCLFLNRIRECLKINSFKDEESDKMSADSTHVQGVSGGVSMDSPVVSDSHSLTIDIEYVFFFQILSLSLILLNRWLLLYY